MLPKSWQGESALCVGVHLANTLCPALLNISDPVFDPQNRFTEPWDLGQDGCSGGDPCKGASLAIVVFNKTADLTDQWLDVGEGATSNGLLGNQSKPAVHLVDPGCLRHL